jgi:hypothetical protein
LHQAARGEEILDPGEAVDSMACVKQHEAEDCADAGHGLPQIQGLGVMVPGGCDDGAFDVTKECIVGGDERQIDCDTLVHGGVGKALGAPLTVGLGGDRFADGG